MGFYQHNGNSGLPPLIGMPEDFRHLRFIREINGADMVIDLSRHDHDMEVLWGEEVPQRLIMGEIGHPKIVYIAVDLNDTDDLENVINAVRTLKEGVGDEYDLPRLPTKTRS